MSMHRTCRSTFRAGGRCSLPCGTGVTSQRCADGGLSHLQAVRFQTVRAVGSISHHSDGAHDLRDAVAVRVRLVSPRDPGS